MKLPFDINEFNPSKSTKLADWNPSELSGGFLAESESLYRTEEGNYFIVLDGGIFSRFSSFPGAEIWFGGLDIEPMTDLEAFAWCEETGNYEVIDEHFPSLKDM